jgi:hypothetical protein
MVQVMLAPLMDHHGRVCYHVGAQLDITRLLENGQGLDSFKRLLNQDEETLRRAPSKSESAEIKSAHNKWPLRLLRELSGLLNDEEIDAVSNREETRNSGDSILSASTLPRLGTHQKRPVFADDLVEDIYPAQTYSPSGRLPGVYQNVNPSPTFLISDFC